MREDFWAGDVDGGVGAGGSPDVDEEDFDGGVMLPELGFHEDEFGEFGVAGAEEEDA